MNRKREPQSEAERLICELIEGAHSDVGTYVRAIAALTAYYDREFKPSREWEYYCLEGKDGAEYVVIKRQDGSEEKYVPIPSGSMPSGVFAAGACAALNALEAAKDE